MTLRRVAVVGTGIAGLACAVQLEAGGIAVRAFDKGRVPGGRMATRRFEGVDFDHGAQFVTAHGHELRSALEAWRVAGVASPWPAARTASAERWVGVPGMTSIPDHLASRLSRPPDQSRHVGALHQSPEGWLVRHFAAAAMPPGGVSLVGGELSGPFDAVAVCLPSPNAASLLATTGHHFADRVREARYEPCWAVMALFATPTGLPDVRSAESGAIGWLARQTSRPGRAPGERFVIHASAEWSREMLEAPEPAVRATLLKAVGLDEEPVAAVAHRWRFSRVTRALGAPCLWDRATGLGAGGDWCVGGRVEAAWESGQALAAAMLGSR